MAPGLATRGRAAAFQCSVEEGPADVPLRVWGGREPGTARCAHPRDPVEPLTFLFQSKSLSPSFISQAQGEDAHHSWPGGEGGGRAPVLSPCHCRGGECSAAWGPAGRGPPCSPPVPRLPRFPQVSTAPVPRHAPTRVPPWSGAGGSWPGAGRGQGDKCPISQRARVTFLSKDRSQCGSLLLEAL